MQKTLLVKLVEEYYFYLTAFLEDKTDFDNPDDLFPTIYRIDRIKSVKVLNEHFRVPYAKRFEEGEFRKRVQFMYGGKLEHIRFRYTGPSLEAVLDESGSGYPYPTAVTLTGSPTLEQRQALSACIAENLAIPAERQTWKQTDIHPAS